MWRRLLAVPAGRDVDDAEVLAGRERFHALGCGDCHVPQLRTGTVADFPEQAFVEADTSDRAALLRFLESL